MSAPRRPVLPNARRSDGDPIRCPRCRTIIAINEYGGPVGVRGDGQAADVIIVDGEPTAALALGCRTKSCRTVTYVDVITGLLLSPDE